MVDILSISPEIALRWIDDQATLLQVMAWCHQASSHYLNQCCSNSMTPYGITKGLIYQLCSHTYNCRRLYNRVTSYALYILFQANIHCADNLGRQALHLVAGTGSIKSLNYLIKIRGVDVNTVSSVYGTTALHIAAKVNMENLSHVINFKIKKSLHFHFILNGFKMAIICTSHGPMS